MRTCKSCRNKFEPTRPMQRVCGFECAHSLIIQTKIKKDISAAKADRRETRQKLEKLKTRSDYIKEAQIAFNRYIRLRDAAKECICCGAALASDAVGGGFDAGHYRSVGSAPHLRFDERNCHAQTKRCNRYGSGRAVDYRRGLIERLGIAVVEAIERDQAPRHYDIDDLKSIKTKYQGLAKELSKA